MDLLAELENMAVNVVDAPDTDPEPDADTIKRWQLLFHYTQVNATEHIKNHRNDLSRAKVSDEHWKMVRTEQEAQGYDREAYEYSAGARKVGKPRTTAPSQHQKLSTYLLKLEGPLDIATKVQKVAGLTSMPDIIDGTGDAGDEARFCRIDNVTRKTILDNLSDIAFQPTFIRISKAEKALSDWSMFPTLGIDSTLPQHRPINIDSASTFSPAQDQYPVWYFFYGSLANPVILSRILSLTDEPNLRPACVTGGMIRTWAGTYKAMVDAPARTSTSGSVDGHAYQVVSREHEEALQYYETEMYEVVRCLITIKDGTGDTIQGLTFRFVGNSEHLV
jgi:Gamma-glutamyl cyclotransferase, AIG2-like